MSFRRRGLHVPVDTIKPAEFDLQYYEVPDRTVEKIGKTLSDFPVSVDDEIEGAVHRRKVDGFWVYFIIANDAASEPVVYVMGVRPEDSEDTLSLVKIAEIIATLRGALGV